VCLSQSSYVRGKRVGIVVRLRRELLHSSTRSGRSGCTSEFRTTNKIKRGRERKEKKRRGEPTQKKKREGEILLHSVDDQLKPVVIKITASE
jgi:hypothetical protein